jgi:tetratricopeptide repeat protein 8
LKCQSLTKKNYIDDIEIDDQNIGDLLLDDHATTSYARPGTSFNRPTTSAQGGGMNPIMRPNSRLGRPTSGMHRTGSRAGTSSGMRLSTAMRTATRGSTSRVVTAGGRLARLGTASLIQSGDLFIDVSKLNLAKIAKSRKISKPLFDYLFYVEKNFKKAIELAAEGTKCEEYEDWWWKERLGRCYYHTGLLRDAEKQLLSSLKIEQTINAYLLLAQIYVKLDQPANTIQILFKAID